MFANIISELLFGGVGNENMETVKLYRNIAKLKHIDMFYFDTKPKDGQRYFAFMDDGEERKLGLIL